MNLYISAFLTASILSFVLTPLAKKLAHKIGAIDVPKDDRRVHKTPIPRLGGLAIYLATFITIFVFGLMGEVTMDSSIVAIFIGASIIVVMGMVDDTKPLSAKVKLVGQIIAALVLVKGGIRIEVFSNPFIEGYNVTSLGVFSIPVTVIWIVGITNTLNLIDGLDGLAAGVGAIASLSLFFVAANFVNISPFYYVVMFIAVVLSGAAVGFLPYNFNPAKIFMGDTGSLFLGYMFAVLSVRGVMKGVTTLSFVLPIVILGLPIFDTAFAIVRRSLKGQPIMQADKGHVHHRFLRLGYTQKQTVLTMYLICVALGMIAFLLSNMTSINYLKHLGYIGSIVFLLIAQISVSTGKKKKALQGEKDK